MVLNTQSNVKILESNKKSALNNLFDKLSLNKEEQQHYTDSTTASNAKQQLADVLATPRQPSKFAIYVKDNYNSVKKEYNLKTHKDVMQELSKKYKLTQSAK